MAWHGLDKEKSGFEESVLSEGRLSSLSKSLHKIFPSLFVYIFRGKSDYGSLSFAPSSVLVFSLPSLLRLHLFSHTYSRLDSFLLGVIDAKPLLIYLVGSSVEECTQCCPPLPTQHNFVELTRPSSLFLSNLHDTRVLMIGVIGNFELAF